MGYVSLWYFSCNAYILGTMFSCYWYEIHFYFGLVVFCSFLLCSWFVVQVCSVQVGKPVKAAAKIQQFLVSERQVRAWKGPEARCSPIAKGGLKDKIGL